MLITYRLKRNRDALNDPIPVRSNVIYRRQIRAILDDSLSTTWIFTISPTIKNKVLLATSQIASETSFSYWWVIGIFLGLILLLSLGTLAYIMKRNHDSAKQTKNANIQEKREINDRKIEQDSKENLKTYNITIISRLQNAPLRNSTENIILYEQEQSTPISSNRIDSEIHSTIDDRNHLNVLDSSEIHGIGKSPLMSMFPSSAKRNKKQNQQTHHEEIQIGDIVSYSNLDDLHIHINKQKQQQQQQQQQQSISNISSKYNSTSTSNKILSSSSIAPNTSDINITSKIALLNKKSNENIPLSSISHSTTNEDNRDKIDNLSRTNITSIYSEKAQHFDDNQSDLSITSLPKLSLTNHGETTSHIPDVPHCKLNVTSNIDEGDNSDDVYIFPIKI